MAEPTIHACALAWGRIGLLITGKSGSGKSTLGHALCSLSDKARWIADDRVVLRTINDAVLASAPDTIKGLAELAYLGVQKVPTQRATRIDAVLQLVEPEHLHRLPDEHTAQPIPNGPSLPCLHLPQKDAVLNAQRAREFFACLTEDVR